MVNWKFVIEDWKIHKLPQKFYVNLSGVVFMEMQFEFFFILLKSPLNFFPAKAFLELFRILMKFQSKCQSDLIVSSTLIVCQTWKSFTTELLSNTFLSIMFFRFRYLKSCLQENYCICVGEGSADRYFCLIYFGFSLLVVMIMDIFCFVWTLGEREICKFLCFRLLFLPDSKKAENRK